MNKTENKDYSPELISEPRVFYVGLPFSTPLTTLPKQGQSMPSGLIASAPPDQRFYMRTLLPSAHILNYLFFRCSAFLPTFPEFPCR